MGNAGEFVNISIVIPVYNQAAYISQAIDSAIAQTHIPHQIIVVNDGSTDDTETVCMRYGSQIQYVKQDNGGPSVARNTGIKRVTGEGVVFLDGDDVLFPRWVEQAVETYKQAVAKGGKIGVVYGDYVVFDEASRYQKQVRIKKVDVPGLLRDPLLIPSGSFVTKECIEAVGYFRDDLVYCEDWDYLLRAALQGYEFIGVPSLSFKHREHGGSLSKQRLTALNGRVMFLQIWLQSDQLSHVQKMAMRQELSRTFLRLRRTAYFLGQPDELYLRQAAEANLDGLMDPWLFVFGAVYASPFFRAQIKEQQVTQSIKDMRRDIEAYLKTTGSLNSRKTRRLRASSILALAANALFEHKYLHAVKNLVLALAADPTLLPDGLRRSTSHVAEIVRARAFI
jgi:glycosyltransferase involved in cell wall biosynthesis